MTDHSTTYTCTVCHETHEDLPALGFITPDPYAELSAAQRAEFQAECDDNFCIIRYPDQTDRFIRVVLDIPIIDHEETLEYGVWVSVSEASFNDYRAHFDDDHEATYFGMICNHIAGYEPSTMFLHCNVNTQPDSRRPFIAPHQAEHPLVRDYTHGISYAEAQARVDAALNGFNTAEAH